MVRWIHPDRQTAGDGTPGSPEPPLTRLAAALARVTPRQAARTASLPAPATVLNCTQLPP